MNDTNGTQVTRNGQLTENASIMLELYVAGASPNSLRAIANAKKIFDAHFPDKYELQIIDVYLQPMIAKDKNIIALPLLVRKQPLPEKRLIGDLSDTEKVLSVVGFLNDEEEWMTQRK